ncbi:MAG: hypothetical protein D6719_12585 [Candidatus Dadabacteria bacterium]|nr:MAG: hypothetical protein D6719_12585 [Candidatus Dadabacteria bacterium]
MLTGDLKIIGFIDKHLILQLIKPAVCRPRHYGQAGSRLRQTNLAVQEHCWHSALHFSITEEL